MIFLTSFEIQLPNFWSDKMPKIVNIWKLLTFEIVNKIDSLSSIQYTGEYSRFSVRFSPTMQTIYVDNNVLQ